MIVFLLLIFLVQIGASQGASSPLPTPTIPLNEDLTTAWMIQFFHPYKAEHLKIKIDEPVAILQWDTDDPDGHYRGHTRIFNFQTQTVGNCFDVDFTAEGVADFMRQH